MLSKCWKVLCVVPVFKNVWERTTAKIYHPSLLYVVDKVLEKLVNNTEFYGILGKIFGLISSFLSDR